jgi:hypothetical protein
MTGVGTEGFLDLHHIYSSLLKFCCLLRLQSRKQMKKKVALKKLEIGKKEIVSLSSKKIQEIKGGQVNQSRYDGCPISWEEREG